MTWRVDVGDCVDLMAAMTECSVDAVVCDPPYGLEFMGKEWDRLWNDKPHGEDNHLPRDANGRSTGLSRWTIERPQYKAGLAAQEWHHRWATEALRVLKPGGHLLAFGGTRTSHRLACAIEDAGFEIRDAIVYLYGSGFPKSLNVGCRCPEGPLPYSHADSSDVLGVRDNGDASSESRGEGEESLLRLPLQRDSAGPRMGEARLEGNGGTETPAGHAWRKESGMEGRRHLLSEEGQLPADQVRASASVGVADGSDGRLRDGASATDGSDGRATVGSGGSGASPRPRPDEQRPGELGALADESAAQTGGAWPTCRRCGKPAAGVGTALKPAHEPVVVARKPLAGTVAANVLEHGTGGLNVDGCRVGTETRPLIEHTGGDATKRGSTYEGGDGIFGSRAAGSTSLGRWPANVVLDEQAAVLLDQQSGELKSGSGPLRRNADKFRNTYGTFKGTDEILPPGDSGGASRFFYTAKASRAERNAGLDGFEEREQAAAYGDIGPMDGNPRKVDTGHIQRVRNHHPTVKPVALMRWLCRLVTPPDGLILDPFAGSGTTGIAAVLEGFNFLGCEQDEAYADIARARVGWWEQHGHDALRIVAEQEAAENEREAVRQSGQMELL